MTRESIFISGCYRSGTTLIEKLLHQHPQITIASQPFPILFIVFKRRFLESRQLARRYPLDHLFLEEGYTPQEFYDFLDGFELDADGVHEFWNEMEGYTQGLWTPEILRFRGDLRPGTFLELYRQLLAFVEELFPKTDLHFVGTKEVLYEEYFPYLIRKGTRVIHMVRDPRGMIASVNFRKRDNQTGQHRPILYSLRAWRKSVAIGLECETSPLYRRIRYEDIADDPITSMQTCTRFLGVPDLPPETLQGEIRDQWGNLWRGNSSFEDKQGVSRASTNAFERVLPEEVKNFIETMTRPEMKLMGYTPGCVESLDRDQCLQFVEPFESIHAAFPTDYSRSEKRVEAEFQRMHFLSDVEPLKDAKEIAKWFLNDRAYSALRKTAAPS